MSETNSKTNNTVNCSKCGNVMEPYYVCDCSLDYIKSLRKEIKTFKKENELLKSENEKQFSENIHCGKKWMKCEQQLKHAMEYIKLVNEKTKYLKWDEGHNCTYRQIIQSLRDSSSAILQSQKEKEK